MVRAQTQKRQSKATGTQTTVLRRKTTKQIKSDVVSCLAKYIKEIVYPDYTELREEIEKQNTEETEMEICIFVWKIEVYKM